MVDFIIMSTNPQILLLLHFNVLNLNSQNTSVICFNLQFCLHHSLYVITSYIFNLHLSLAILLSLSTWPSLFCVPGYLLYSACGSQCVSVILYRQSAAVRHKKHSTSLCNYLLLCFVVIYFIQEH